MPPAHRNRTTLGVTKGAMTSTVWNQASQVGSWKTTPRVRNMNVTCASQSHNPGGHQECHDINRLEPGLPGGLMVDHAARQERERHLRAPMRTPQPQDPRVPTSGVQWQITPWSSAHPCGHTTAAASLSRPVTGPLCACVQGDHLAFPTSCLKGAGGRAAVA